MIVLLVIITALWGGLMICAGIIAIDVLAKGDK
jgi:hypothetical protein